MNPAGGSTSYPGFLIMVDEQVYSVYKKFPDNSFSFRIKPFYCGFDWRCNYQNYYYKMSFSKNILVCIYCGCTLCTDTKAIGVSFLLNKVKLVKV